MPSDAIALPRIHRTSLPNPHGHTGSHEITFYEWGDPFAPAIFCVHGLTRNGRDFDFLARVLAEDYRLICPDIAGRGKSAPFQQLQWYDNSTYMQDMLALAEHLNLSQFGWIGTSMGGIIGMMIAAFAPGKITRLVLNDVGAVLPKEGLERIATYVGRDSHFTDQLEAEQYLRQVMKPFNIQQDDHWAHVLEHSLEPLPNGGVRLAYDPNIGNAFRLVADSMGIQDISLWMLWEAIRIPTLIIRGANSDVLPHAIAQQMCKGHPQAELVEFPGIGHAPTLMEDNQIAVIKNWLDCH